MLAGDVRVIPHLLHDSMLNNVQTGECRAALYGGPRTGLPVSPLSITERALDDIHRIGEHDGDATRVIAIGGDHSVGWPAFVTAFKASRRANKRIGCLHFDAHTDLMPSRLGVKYCFATWAYHANELLERDGRMVQVGIRASGRERDHWESEMGVRQFWSGRSGGECERLGPEALAVEVISILEARDVDCVYVSVDIDALADRFAGATGTPEPDGLSPEFVCKAIEIVGRRFPIVAGDLVEVAPPLRPHTGEPKMTLDSACRILETLLTA